MMTYLKHVGNFKHSELKNKKFKEIQALYEKIKRLDEDFIAIGSAEDERMIKEMNEKGIESLKDDSVKEKVKEEEGTQKRKSGHIKMIARKKPRSLKDVDSDDEHRRCLKIVTFEGTIDSEVMETKLFISRYFISLIDKICMESSRWIKTVTEWFLRFDRMDFEELYSLVMKRFHKSTPEGIDLILWRDLRTIGVHILVLEDDTKLFMLAERRYPLTKETLEKMMDLKLVAKTESDSAYDLLRFIQKQIDKHKNWLVHKQTPYGKDFSNLFMVDNLQKIIGFSTYLVSLVKSWLLKRWIARDAYADGKCLKKRSRYVEVFGYILQELEKINLKKHDVKQDKVKKDIEEIETINIELDHRVSKLIAENEHLKQTYKQLYDSIKPTRIRSKEQELVITALKNDLRKLKGKTLVENAVTKHTIDLNEQAVILKEIHSKLNANSELICVKCNGCMLYDNHDLSVLNSVNDVRAKSKSIKKISKRKVWKPTGKVFTNIGYTWRPTGRTFTLVGNECPLTKITTTIEVPPRKPIALEIDTPKHVVTLVYSRKPMKPKPIDLVGKTKKNKSISANKKEPSKS
ncbi:hypothetical protein Tco_0984285 [Tanacetum coccineum]